MTKREALELHKQTLSLAEALFKKDPKRYGRQAFEGSIFGWINRQVKQGKDLRLVARAVEILHRKENSCRVEGPIHYLGGTLRKLEQEEQAKTLRASGATMEDLLAPLLKRHS